MAGWKWYKKLRFSLEPSNVKYNRDVLNFWSLRIFTLSITCNLSLCDCVLIIAGDVVSNSTYTAIGYSVMETIAGDSVISVLMASSFSLSMYIQSAFSCIGVAGNPFHFGVTSTDTPPITSRCKHTHQRLSCSNTVTSLRMKILMHNIKFLCSLVKVNTVVSNLQLVNDCASA